MQRSRWAEDESAQADPAGQRKKERDEKRRLKEEKAKTGLLNTQSSGSKLISDADSDRDRPTKRQKTTTASSTRTAEGVESSNLLQFPSRTFGPCRDVSQYELLNNIEEGSYGMVSRAREKKSGEIVALKHLKIDQANEGFPVTGLREIQTLMASHHPNIVTLREVVLGTGLNDVYIVMEFLEHDLKTVLEDMVEPFLPSEVKTLMLQIVSATKYLHSNWIMHRDLKTTNLLLNNRGEVKLADFGMARYTGSPPPRLTQLVVTLWYRAPELLLGTNDYSFEIDIWSLGCIFAELLTRDPLFQGRNEVDQLSKIFGLLGPPTNETWPGFRSLPNAKALHPILSKILTTTTTTNPKSNLNPTTFPYLTSSGFKLISSMLSLNPRDRPTAPEILDSPYFREDPRPKAKEMFPTFPSKANQEKRRRKTTPQAPVRGDAPALNGEEFAGLFARQALEEQGGGFSLRLG